MREASDALAPPKKRSLPFTYQTQPHTHTHDLHYHTHTHTHQLNTHTHTHTLHCADMLMSKTRPYYCERTPAVMADPPLLCTFTPWRVQGSPGGEERQNSQRLVHTRRETDQREDGSLAETLP